MKEAKAKKQASPGNRANLTLVARIFFLIEVLAMAAGTVYTTVLQLLPMKYIFVLMALVLLICGLHLFLLLHKKAVRTLRILSILLSVVVLLVVAASTYMLSIVHSSVSDMPETDEEVVVDVPKADVTKDPFIVYLSGMDTRGSKEIKDKGLSDVNMLIAVNPTAKKMLMVNIPRDYYVPLYGDTNKMDKLTHGGQYGVDCSMKTLNALFDVRCNYYVKVNFQSVVDIVDALGGVTVTSDFYFSSRHSLSGKTYSFVKGENTLMGDAALAFARERESLSGGDRQRGIHQQKIISAILDEAMSPSILNPANLKNVLSAITDHTKTNVSYDDISALVRMQLNDMASWDIDTMSVDGTGSYQPSYAAGGQVLYVMQPDMETVQAAKAAIDAVQSTAVVTE